MKQQEWENEQNRLAAEEAIRQYNEQMAYQKEQDKIANAQKWAQIKASKQKMSIQFLMKKHLMMIMI